MPFDKHETITYKLNELALKLFQTGGLAILMSINILSQIKWSSYTQLGGELTKQDETHNFAEVDLFWLTEHCLTIVECKSIYNNGDFENISDKVRQRIEDTYQQFKTLITDVAPLIDAKVAVLSIVTNIPDLIIIELLRVNELQNLGEENKIKIHLIINWELYINGEEKLDLITQRPQIMSRFFPHSYSIEELDTIKVEFYLKESHNKQGEKENHAVIIKVIK
ncbi:MAG: hypothetical protein QNJ66_22615 [Crocosphaera sp.]|nr:hypothetical protein [Crocosphaera sp.]